MFTVLHRAADDTEMLYNANHVQWLPFNEGNGDASGVHMLCGPVEAAHGVHVGHLKDGVAFVMNELGKTVATYHMHKYERPPADQKAA